MLDTEGSMATLAAGRDCDSYCGRCKLVLAHVIHAMDSLGRTPVRVECKTCRAIHAYRPHEPGGGARKRTSSKSPSARKPRSLGLFDELMDGRDISSPTPYTVTTAFEKDAVINHQKFGLGLVTRELGGKKIEVAFRDERRILIHHR